jgi:hypothetical protein
MPMMVALIRSVSDKDAMPNDGQDEKNDGNFD